MFIDASAAVALIASEALAAHVSKLIDDSTTGFHYSPVSHWEMVVAIARIHASTSDATQVIVDDWLYDIDAHCIPITANVGIAALAAHSRYGKGTGHPAKLNMGDCFAYACAKSLNIPLLYVGDDFSHTDLALEN